MRDVFRPCYQLEQLFVRGVANVRHCILCIARDAELIGAFSWNSYARPFHENISSRRRCSYGGGKKFGGKGGKGASFAARVRTTSKMAKNFVSFVWWSVRVNQSEIIRLKFKIYKLYIHSFPNLRPNYKSFLQKWNASNKVLESCTN